MDSSTKTPSSLSHIIDKMYPDMLSKQEIMAMLNNLKSKRDVSQKEIAELILHIAETHHRGWPIETILSCLNEVFDSINWRGVYENFAMLDLNIWNTQYLYTIVDCWVSVSGIITVPYEIFFRPWPARSAQIEFLRVLLESDDRRTQVYANIFFEKLISKEEIRQTRYKRSIEYENNLNSVDLFKCIRDIQAEGIIELARAKSPEYCLLGLGAVRPFCQDIFDDLLVTFCGASASNFLYQSLFNRDNHGMLYAFKRIRDRISLSRILDILVEHKILSVVIELMDPIDLAFDIIILAVRREHLNLDVWLNNSIKNHMSAFIDHIHSKILNQDGTFPPDSEIFPFTKSIVVQAVKTFIKKDLDPFAQRKLAEIRNILDDGSAEGPFTSDKAVAFISEIINSHAEVEDSVFKIKDLLSGDEASSVFAKKIFGLLVDNYANLYKLPNSDLLAAFFGELIRQKVFIKPYLKMSLHLVKNSLVNPSCDREFAFAFRILESFLSAIPEFFTEIESVEAARAGLIKKELILIDEDAQQLINLRSLLEHIIEPSDCSDEKIAAYVAESNYDIGNASSSCARNAVAAKLFAFSSRGQNGRECIGQVPHAALASYIFRHISEDPALWAAFVRAQPEPFQTYIVEAGFEIVKNSFLYSIDDEISFYESLGILLGLSVVGQDRSVCLDLFDFHTFILKSIEYRRITLSVTFVTSFFKQGTAGIICVPRNPWLMDILSVLSELYPCTLAHVRERISRLFAHFKLPMERKTALRIKDHLIKYILTEEGVIRQVVSAALDFSVREVCNKIVKASVGVAKSTATEIFLRMLSKHKENGHYFFFRNLLINLTRALISVSAQEPLRASICGNITHFLKLSGNELSLEEIYKIAADNLPVCRELIEKVGITSVCEQAVMFYSSVLKQTENILDKAPELIKKYNLKIISESHFVEKTHVRSIENAEYQEIRSFLIQLGRKTSAKKRDVISESWHLLLGPNGDEHFIQMLENIESAPDRDMHCLSLCKYLVGHAIKTECSNDSIFKYITRILAISPKTNHEVVSWLIYSGDQKRYNIKLIKKFISYDLIRLDEYDQALMRLLVAEEPKGLQFVLDLLYDLILGDLRLCTVYDFIHTIETLNKINDNQRVFEFFKEVEAGMMRIGERSDELFDEFLRTERIEISSATAKAFRAFCKKRPDVQFSFINAVRGSWHHFVLYSGPFRFYKIDVLACLANNDFYGCIKETLPLLAQAYSKRNYLFFSFFGRFFESMLDVVEDTAENRAIIFRMLEILSTLPGFVTYLIRILDHSFCTKYLERSEIFFVLKSLLVLVKHSRACEPVVLDFFSRHSNSIRRLNPYLSYFCPEDSPSLKNLFNSCRSKVPPEKGTNPYFAAQYSLSKHQKVIASYSILVDNLCETSMLSAHAADALRSMLDRKQNVKEILLLVLLRKNAANPPPALAAMYDELAARKDVKELLSKYEMKYYNKV